MTSHNWKDFISREINLLDSSINYCLEPPVSHDQIVIARKQLSLIDFPEELIGLYLASNGVVEAIENDKIGYLILPIDKIVAVNLSYRDDVSLSKLYMSFDQMLFFSEVGNGDLFFYIVIDGEVIRPDIFVWDHGTDSRTWVAPSLQKFISGWVSGTISV